MIISPVYTFLATLVLLLAVSSAIVIRSLILRRRHQRIVEEAIRAGTWLPNQPYEPRGTRRRRDIGRKPKLWEAWLRSGEEEAEEAGKSKCAWDDIMPVYAAHIHMKSAPIPREEEGEEESPQIRTDASSNSPSSRTMRFLRPFRTPFSPPKSSPIIPQTPSSPLVSAPPAVSVAVLIAMPMPRHSNSNSREADGPPVIELGVVNVPLRDVDMGESGEKP
ncbi:hypothetical protein EDD22DRAFT_934799 [Suillus occidentalis]|nr:hypothetical protein EDD22DRAFT_934799 [Suillus occidentalis]